MSKYIRLKDRITKINKEDSKCYYFDKRKNFIYKSENYRISKDLKDLIDIYLIKSKYGYNEMIKNFEDMKKSIQKGDTVYGCIYIDDLCFKSTVKLNRRGKLKCL